MAFGRFSGIFFVKVYSDLEVDVALLVNELFMWRLAAVF